MTHAYYELCEAAGDEDIIGIVFGEGHWWTDESRPENSPSKEDIENCRIFTLEEAKPHMLSWSFNGGYGSAECFPIFAWTNTRVFLVGHYDGSTWLESVPRYPSCTKPFFVGGG